MLARALQLQLALEAAFYIALGGFLGAKLGWNAGRIGVLVVMLFIAARIALVAATFAIAWWYRTPRRPAERLTVGASLRLFCGEAWAFIALFSVIQPFERWLMAPDRLRPVSAHEHPILLVHGYLCNRGVWRWLRTHLEDNGRCVATVNLEPALASIDDSIDQLKRRIDEVVAAAGARELTVIAHSMGGLVVRAYVARYEASPVARVITLGTPHRGSAMAALGWGLCGREMRSGSEWLQRLAGRTLPPACQVTSIYSRHDNFVMPQANQMLEGAANIALCGIGHLALLSSPAVLGEIERMLAAPTLTST